MGLVCPSDWESQERQGALRQNGHLAELGEILFETQHLICEMIYSGNKRLMLLTFSLLLYSTLILCEIYSCHDQWFEFCLSRFFDSINVFVVDPVKAQLLNFCLWLARGGLSQATFSLETCTSPPLPSSIPPFGKLAQPTGCQCWAWGASQTWVCSSLGS